MHPRYYPHPTTLYCIESLFQLSSQSGKCNVLIENNENALQMGHLSHAMADLKVDNISVCQIDILVTIKKTGHEP